jgi:hypothetical protein
MEEIRMIYLAEDNTPTPRAGYGCGYACQDFSALAVLFATN